MWEANNIIGPNIGNSLLTQTRFDTLGDLFLALSASWAFDCSGFWVLGLDFGFRASKVEGLRILRGLSVRLRAFLTSTQYHVIRARRDCAHLCLYLCPYLIDTSVYIDILIYIGTCIPVYLYICISAYVQLHLCRKSESTPCSMTGLGLEMLRVQASLGE